MAGNAARAQSACLTQFEDSFSTAFVNQDGNRPGNFGGAQVDEDGIVPALFDNGQTTPIRKLAVATFPNPNDLDARSGNVFAQSERPGGFILREAGKGSARATVSGSLEASTIDPVEQFTDMIVTQRAYSVATRIIIAADGMSNELIQLANQARRGPPLTLRAGPNRPPRLRPEAEKPC